MYHKYFLLLRLLLTVDRIRRAYNVKYEFFVYSLFSKQDNNIIEEDVCIYITIRVSQNTKYAIEILLRSKQERSRPVSMFV